jgi:hypothetical protein
MSLIVELKLEVESACYFSAPCSRRTCERGNELFIIPQNGNET